MFSPEDYNPSERIPAPLPQIGTRGTVGAEKHPQNPHTGGIMSIILASRTNVYSGSPLARVGEKREDEAWIHAALKHPDSLFVIAKGKGGGVSRTAPAKKSA